MPDDNRDTPTPPIPGANAPIPVNIEDEMRNSFLEAAYGFAAH